MRWDDSSKLTALVIIFIISIGALIMLRTPEPDLGALILTVTMAAMTIICARVLPRWNLVDPLLITLMNFLCSLGALLQYSISPTVSGLMHAMFYAAGLVLLIAISAVVRLKHSFRDWRLWILGASLFFLALTLTSPIFEHNDARSWIPIPWLGRARAFTIQPSEFVKVAMIALLADIMSDQPPQPIPPLIYGAGIAASFIGLLFLQNDLGTGLVYFLTALTVLYCGTADMRVLAGGAMSFAAAALFVYRISVRVQNRILAFADPFLHYKDFGFQVSRSLMSIANGGATGAGLGLGRSASIPLYDTDFVFATICEQFGIVFGLAVVCVYVIMVMRGMHLAVRASRRFHALLAVGCSTVLAVQTFIIIGGVINMIPLTGVTLPFISKGGSSLLSSMINVGVLCGVHACVERDQKRGREYDLPKPARRGRQAAVRGVAEV